MMFTCKIWKAGNSYVVTIPREEMGARGLQVGQLVGIDPVPLEICPVTPLTPEQRAGGWQTQADAERDLADRIARDVATGLVTREAIAQAEQEIEQGAEWAR